MSIRKYKTIKGGKTRYAVNIFNKHTGKTEWVGTFKTSEDAKLAFAEKDRELRMGVLSPQRKEIGFSDLVDEWLRLQTVNLRKGTKDDYRYSSRYLREFFKNKPVSAIEYADVFRFVAWISGQGLSAHYVLKIHTRLSQIFRFADSMGYTNRQPMKERVSNLPEKPDKRVKPLTAAEVRALTEATPSEWEAAILVMVTCGLRRSETFGLTRSNVDLEHSLIRVTHQLANGELVEPKTKRSKRTIPMPEMTRKALGKHLAVSPANDLDLVFVNELGHPVDYMNFRKRIWIPAIEKAGLRKDLTLHDLRRTFASAMARQGRSAGYLQDVMGHQQATTTMDYYIGVYDEERGAAIADFEDWLSREAPDDYDTAA